MLNNFIGFRHQDKISNLLILLVIISFPFNYKIFLFLRPQDFFVICFILINFNQFKKRDLQLSSLIILFLTTSCFLGYLYFEKFYIHKLAIIYKLLTPILFIILIKNYFNESNKNFLIIAINSTFIIYLLYVIFFWFLFQNPLHLYFDIQLFPSSISIGSGIPTDLTVDRHLMGSIVGIFFAANTIYLLEQKNNFNTKFLNLSILFILMLVFMKLFSSRGFYLYGLITLYFVLNFFFQRSLKKKYQIFLNYLILIFILIVLLILVKNNFFSNPIFYDFRYFKYLFLSETTLIGQSATRITSWYQFFPDSILPILFGRGVTSFPQIFHDNGLTVILVNFGIIPSILILLFIRKNYQFNEKTNFSLKILLFITIIINLVITEYFLISRYVYILTIIFFLFDYKTKSSISIHKN